MSFLNSKTPIPADPFTRTMAGMFDEKKIIGVSTAFQSLFGRSETGAETIFSPNSLVVDIDIIRGKKKIAALIPRGSISRPLGALSKNRLKERYSTFSRKFPLSEEEGDITGDQILFKSAGENAFQTMTRFDRMRGYAVDIHNDNIRSTVDMQELLASKSILEGKQPAIIGTTDADQMYDFMRKADHIKTVAIGWNQTTNTWLDDVDLGCNKISVDAKSNPDYMCVGTEANAAIIRDAETQNLADIRRYELVKVGKNVQPPSKFNHMIANGWEPTAELFTPQGRRLWIFINHEFYEDETTSYPYMPVDQAFIGASSARFDRYFGPPERLPLFQADRQLYMELFGFDMNMPPMPPNTEGLGNVINSAMYYCDAYIAEDRKKVTVRTQSAPIYATTQTDAIYTLKGLIT